MFINNCDKFSISWFFLVGHSFRYHIYIYNLIEYCILYTMQMAQYYLSYSFRHTYTCINALYLR